MKRLLWLLVLSVVMLSGCWDNWEVDERGIVLGIGLDKGQSSPPQSGTEGQLEERSDTVCDLTMQMVEPGMVAGSEKGGSGGQGEPYWNLVVPSSGSIFEAVREAGTRTNRAPYFEHLQVLVIGEELARAGVEKTLDTFFRDNEIRRRVLVYVTSAKAQEVLEVKPRQEAVNAVYLASLQENSNKTAHFAPRMHFGSLARSIHEGSSYLMPRIIPAEKEAKVSGSGVFKGDRLLGWLGEMETQGVRLVTGEIRGGSIKVISEHSRPGQKDAGVYEFMEVKSNIEPEITGDKIAFEVKIQSEGRLMEHQDPEDTLDAAHLRATEEQFAKEIEKQATLAIKKLQQEFQADVLGFGRKVEEQEPQVWKEVKGRWDEIFADLEVRVQADVSIRRVGLTR